MRKAGGSQPTIVGELTREIAESYPDLRVIAERGLVHVRGSFPIIHEGQVLDRFQIAIELPQGFPARIPTVRETGGRVPLTPERHMNLTGEACVLVPEEWEVLPAKQRTLRAFLDGPVRSFFIGQALGGVWPGGARTHGRAGLLEAYGEMLGVQDAAAIPKYLKYLAQKKIKGHWLCPCGSGRALRNCHRDAVQKLRDQIPRQLAKRAFDRLKPG